MKFFHVYNEECYKGLEKNGLINKDTGFKIQHAFCVPEDMKFNRFAAKGSKLYNLIKEGKHPFYVDRIAGGIIYHKYDFDIELIREYEGILGKWFLGFQLHESVSNIRGCDWVEILNRMGTKGPYDPVELEKACTSSYAKMSDGTVLSCFGHGSPQDYAKLRYAETPAEVFEEAKAMFAKRMEEVDGHILPCDSYYLATKMQDEMGMQTFMPEVGWQIPLMRQQVALARGIAKASGKTWGTYYECWRADIVDGRIKCCMPCFNTDSNNEWYLTQEIHPDDFTRHGKNGGSSRLLQNRIYYHSLMSGADYLSEEWGLNCSYTDMKEFTLSEYGQLKKDFIRAAEDLQGVQAVIPFAIVLPVEYNFVELPDPFTPHILGVYDDHYLRSSLNPKQKDDLGHVEDVLKLFFARNGEVYGNEGHVITNSRFGDVMDIIYEDASDETLSRYEYLIDATRDGAFARAKAGRGFKILESSDIEKLACDMEKLIPQTMPCYVDGLCWLVSVDNRGRRFLSIFNNEGNERTSEKGDVICREADQRVKITMKEPANIKVFRETMRPAGLERVDEHTYYATIPAADFMVLEF